MQRYQRRDVKDSCHFVSQKFAMTLSIVSHIPGECFLLSRWKDPSFQIMCCCKEQDAAMGVFIAERLADNTILYIAVNFAGMYTKYLTDRGQRKAFLETHRSMETRCRTQKENDRQEKLLLSGKSVLEQRISSLSVAKSVSVNFAVSLYLPYCTAKDRH
jgi:hypothetical protein